MISSFSLVKCELMTEYKAGEQGAGTWGTMREVKHQGEDEDRGRQS